MARPTNEHGDSWESGCSCGTCSIRRFVDWHRSDGKPSRSYERSKYVGGGVVLQSVMGCLFALLVGVILFLGGTVLMLVWGLS